MLSPSVVVALVIVLAVVIAAPASARKSTYRVHENFHTLLERDYELGRRQRPQQSGNVNTFTISQPLDHFDRLNPGRYNQTYWTNEQYWNGTGPVFLYLGGEWQEGPGTLEYGANVMSVWAQTFGGAMVDIQHRYYNGVPLSIPDNTTGLQYLSSQQALADVAAVVAHLNNEWRRTRGVTGLKWIHMGGSYAGNMAAWFRLKYPNLSVGAFAISGPVQATVDYSGFFSVEGHDLNLTSPACLNFTRSAVKELEGYVADPVKGWPKILNDFGVTLRSQLDAAAWAFDLGWGLLSSGSICQSQENQSPYDALAKIWKTDYPSYNATYDANKVWPDYSWLWYYQTCTEMGYYQTGTDFDRNPMQIMPRFMTPEYFTTACEQVYGIKQQEVWDNSDFTNTFYGGKYLTTTNTFFTHGDADGWSAAGVTYTDRPVPVFGNSVHIISRGTHCSDLYFPTDSDSDSLKAVHKAQINQIGQWLREADEGPAIMAA